ncbi:MAG: DNA-protecting protein DprA, partial [Actinobacteria bacterium]|nr:DNA-protecting protein DprA [Actinomycetota bacterium]
NDLKYLIALTHFPKFGPVRIGRIKKRFSFWEDAFHAPTQELIRAGIEENIAEEFAAARNSINPEEIMEKLEKENIKIVAADDKLYPKPLKEIYGPPALIYYRGLLSEDEEFNLAVVGSRKYSSYGQMAVEQIVEDLAKNNLTIVSGLALGIDALAHNATLKARGRTIAVLGSGLDKQSIYPSSNRYLADKIVDSGGAIISEFPIGSPPLKHHFPQRNRVISGLSLGTLVIEASRKSGSLITARFALEQNREVFAVPGSIYSPNSDGANDLIKKGAKTTTCAADIMETLDLAQVSAYIDNKKIIPETPEEENLLNHLKKEPMHINDLIRLTKLDTNIINSTLTIMEMKGMIRNIGNMEYVLAR